MQAIKMADAVRPLNSMQKNYSPDDFRYRPSSPVRIDLLEKEIGKGDYNTSRLLREELDRQLINQSNIKRAQFENRWNLRNKIIQTKNHFIKPPQNDTTYYDDRQLGTKMENQKSMIEDRPFRNKAEFKEALEYERLNKIARQLQLEGMS